MSLLTTIADIFQRGLDDAATGVAAAFTALRRPRRVSLRERPDGAFDFREGGGPSALARLGDGGWFDASAKPLAPSLARARVDVILEPRRFVFNEIELPRRAGDFLEGVVRAQIDSLTPWKPQEAAFGWTPPRDLGGDRIGVTVATTPRASIAALARALEDARVEAYSLSTPLENSSLADSRIEVLAHRPGDADRNRRWRNALAAILALAVLAALGSGLTAAFVGGDAEAQADALQARIAAKRAALQLGHGSAAEQALAALNARRRGAPASVLVIEALSRTLPDDVYLTQLHIEGDKVQFAGLAADAPELIRLVEQSRVFSHAVFDAPTTRTPNEAGERFHIEAHADPFFEVKP